MELSGKSYGGKSSGGGKTFFHPQLCRRAETNFKLIQKQLSKKIDDIQKQLFKKLLSKKIDDVQKQLFKQSIIQKLFMKRLLPKQLSNLYAAIALSTHAQNVWKRKSAPQARKKK